MPKKRHHKKPHTPMLPFCKKCGLASTKQPYEVTFADGTVHWQADCHQCGKFIQYIRPSRLPAEKRCTLSPEQLARTIAYPNAHSEFEIQAFLWSEMRRKGLDVRGEVKTHDWKCRFDLVVFKEKMPTLIIEIKKRRDAAQRCDHQIKRYGQFLIPVKTIVGMKEAVKYYETL